MKKLDLKKKFKVRVRKAVEPFKRKRKLTFSERRRRRYLRRKFLLAKQQSSIIQVLTDKVNFLGTKPYFPWGVRFSRKLGRRFSHYKRFKQFNYNFIFRRVLYFNRYKQKKFLRRLNRKIVVCRRNYAHYKFYRRAATRFFNLKDQLYVRESFFKRLYYQFFMYMIRPTQWWRKKWFLRTSDLKHWFIPKQWTLLGRVWFLRKVKDKNWYKKVLGAKSLTAKDLFRKSLAALRVLYKWQWWSRFKRKRLLTKPAAYGITLRSTSNNIFLVFYKIGTKHNKFIFATTAGAAGLSGRAKSSVPGAQEAAKKFCRKIAEYLRENHIGPHYMCRVVVKSFFSKKLKLILREFVRARLRLHSILFRFIKAHNGCRLSKARRK